MNLPKAEILEKFAAWLIAWNEHNLDGVMEFMHEEVVFENWNGATVTGKSSLRKSWEPWFRRHGNFTFTKEALLIDEQEQVITFTWKLQWPSFETKYAGKPEKRRGLDVLYLKEGKIHRKDTYSKTVLEINATKVSLQAV